MVFILFTMTTILLFFFFFYDIQILLGSGSEKKGTSEHKKH